jgi:hypothetical protein
VEKRLLLNNFISVEMSANVVQTLYANLDIENQNLRRQSVLSSSNPNSDSLPIDCILVYDRIDRSEVESSNDQQRKKHENLSEHRRKFEEFLCKKHGLILETAVSSLNSSNNSFHLFIK